MAVLKRRALPANLTLGAALALAILGPLSPAVLAVDPTAAPPAGSARESCAERYPAEGPAGVDLRLGCVVSELVGLYTAGQSSDPPALSTYGLAIGAAVILAIIAVAATGKLLGRRVGARLAPVQPGAWWRCETCRSINAVAAAQCYSCGRPRGAGPMLATEERPEMPQSFGQGKRG